MNSENAANYEPSSATLWLQRFCLGEDDAALSGEIKIQPLEGEEYSTTELFPGASAFMPWHFSIFSGRHAHIQAVLSRVLEKGFVAVLGGSGTGKSSLVLAGVLPILLTQDTGDVPAQWVPVVFKPDISPLENLATNLSSWYLKLTGYALQQYGIVATVQDEAEWRTSIMSAMKEPFGIRQSIHDFHASLDKILQANQVTDKVRFKFLLVVDQFEEAFIQAQKTESNVFFDRLTEEYPATAIQLATDAPFGVLLSMRSEYLEHCQEYTHLTEVINETLYVLPALEGVVTVDALLRSFHAASNIPVFVEKDDYHADETLGTWLLAESHKIYGAATSAEQDFLAVAQVTLRAIWIDSIRRQRSEAFPLSMQTLERFMSRIGWRSGAFDLLEVFQAVLRDLQSSDPQLAIWKGAAPTDLERLYLDKALALAAVTDVAYSKFSKRVFSAEEVARRVRIGGDLAATTSGLEKFTEKETYVPIFRQLNRPPVATFELIHEAFIRRWPLLRMTTEKIGAQVSDAAMLMRPSVTGTYRRFFAPLTNFLSVDVYGLWKQDREVLTMIHRRAVGRGGQTANKRPLDVFGRDILRSLLVPPAFLALCAVLIFWFASELSAQKEKNSLFERWWVLLSPPPADDIHGETWSLFGLQLAEKKAGIRHPEGISTGMNSVQQQGFLSDFAYKKTVRGQQGWTSRIVHSNLPLIHREANFEKVRVQSSPNGTVVQSTDEENPLFSMPPQLTPAIASGILETCATGSGPALQEHNVLILVYATHAERKMPEAPEREIFGVALFWTADGVIVRRDFALLQAVSKSETPTKAQINSGCVERSSGVISATLAVAFEIDGKPVTRSMLAFLPFDDLSRAPADLRLTQLYQKLVDFCNTKGTAEEYTIEGAKKMFHMCADRSSR